MESQLLGWLAMPGTVAVALPEAFSEHLEDSVNQICAAASVYCCSIGCGVVENASYSKERTKTSMHSNLPIPMP